MGFWSFVKSALRDDRKRRKAKQKKVTGKRGTRGSAAVKSSLTPYQQGELDGYKGRANRYASDDVRSRSAWAAASKTARHGYAGPLDNGLSQDPYGNATMIRLQLAAPGTPAEYRRGYMDGTAQRRREK